MDNYLITSNFFLCSYCFLFFFLHYNVKLLFLSNNRLNCSYFLVCRKRQFTNESYKFKNLLTTWQRSFYGLTHIAQLFRRLYLLLYIIGFKVIARIYGRKRVNYHNNSTYRCPLFSLREWLTWNQGIVIKWTVCHDHCTWITVISCNFCHKNAWWQKYLTCHNELAWTTSLKKS